MKLLKWLPLAILLLLLAACGDKDIESNMSEEVKPFEFTNQDNKKFGLDDLKGDWWVADFIFTNCETVCLPMTSNMVQIQNKAKEEKLDVQFVSFSVDPKRDTPAVLKEYAKKYNADTANWNFLTGYDFQTIKELSIKSFKSMIAPPPENDDSDQVMHGTSFLLVNPEGTVIKSYKGVQAETIDQIIEDLKKVQS